MPIYLDNAATTRVCPEAARAALEAMTEGYGNPSSGYALGQAAAAALKEHRAAVAGRLGCAPEELVFTSCGTEGDNWAVRAAADYGRRKGRHIITTAIEHAAVLEPVKALAAQGYEVTYLKPDRSGHVSPDALRAALREAPDIILLGEMRDAETIKAAVTAAETGHLVISTLHTIGAANTVDRIVDAFPPAQQQQIRTQLALVLEGVVSQQLLQAEDGAQVPAFEVMTVNPAVRNMIRESKAFQLDSVIASSSQEGMVTMDQSILRLVQAGRVHPDTALRHAANSDWMIRRLAALAGGAEKTK